MTTKTFAVTLDTESNQVKATLVINGEIEFAQTFDTEAVLTDKILNTVFNQVGQEMFNNAEPTIEELHQFIANDGLSALQEAVLDCFDGAYSGLTVEQAHEYSTIPLSTFRPRCTELVQMGFLVETGARRPTDAGVSARVYRSRLV